MIIFKCKSSTVSETKISNSYYLFIPQVNKALIYNRIMKAYKLIKEIISTQIVFC